MTRSSTTLLEVIGSHKVRHNHRIEVPSRNRHEDQEGRASRPPQRRRRPRRRRGLRAATRSFGVRAKVAAAPLEGRRRQREPDHHREPVPALSVDDIGVHLGCVDDFGHGEDGQRQDGEGASTGRRERQGEERQGAEARGPHDDDPGRDGRVESSEVTDALAEPNRRQANVRHPWEARPEGHRIRQSAW